MILEMRFTGYDLLQTTIAVIFGVGIGIIIGHFGISEYVSDGVRNRRSLSNVADIDSFFQQNINNESIGEYLKQLTWQPHVGGTPEDEITLVNFIQTEMAKANLITKTSEYEVLLSYPKREEGMRNYVAVHDGDGSIVWEEGIELKSAEVEEIISPSQNNSLVFNPFM